MRKGKSVLVILVVAALAVLLSGCITAPKMSYQGKLTDPAGAPVPNGNYDMTFRLWGLDLFFNPIVVWEETQSVAVADGLFNVVLGSTTPLTPNIFIQPLDLGIEVNGDGEMTPRQPLTGAPYAMTLVDGAAMGGGAIALEADLPGMFNLSNMGTGYGIAMESYGKAGLAVDGMDSGLYGLLIDNVDAGAAITNSAGIGVQVISTGDAGVHTQSMAYGPGAFGWAHANAASFGWGIDGRGQESYGLYAFSDAVGEYGGYFADPIFVNGGCTGCALRYIARNDSAGTLPPGAAVTAAGVETGLEGMQAPVFKVALATPGQAVLGIVVGQVQVTMIGDDQDYAQPGAHFSTVGGPAAPGDYLVIVVQGPAQVQAAPTARVAAGSLVYLGSNGVTTDASGPAIGMALEAVAPDGLVWVLVGFH